MKNVCKIPTHWDKLSSKALHAVCVPNLNSDCSRKIVNYMPMYTNEDGTDYIPPNDY